MRRALRTGMEEHGDRQRPDRRRARGPTALDELGELPVADVALIAHVGYDIEEIGPFIDAMERGGAAAAASRC